MKTRPTTTRPTTTRPTCPGPGIARTQVKNISCVKRRRRPIGSINTEQEHYLLNTVHIKRLQEATVSVNDAFLSLQDWPFAKKA
jgi:hypothetical protein